MDEPALLWDQHVESALTRQKSQPSKPRQSSLAKLQLAKQAKPTCLPRVPRSIAEIEDGLRLKIRGLVAGELPWPLFLEGAVGTGKTCAALCLLDLAGGEYHTVSGLCNLIIQSQQGRLEWVHECRGGTIWPHQVWSKIASAPLAVLDEMGCREKASDAHYENVKNFIEERMWKPLIVISNLPLEQVAAIYDDRIYSRLASGTVVRLEGKDRRV
jgi:hypothetical protein